MNWRFLPRPRHLISRLRCLGIGEINYMKIELYKIVRHKWFPFITKEVLFKITPDKPIEDEIIVVGEDDVELLVETKTKSYIRPMCVSWEMTIKDGREDKIRVNY